jgi:Holliday junction resolvase
LVRKIRQEKDNQKLTTALLEDVKNLSGKKQSLDEKVETARKLVESHKHLHRYRKKRISKNTAYKRGRAFEYRVKKHFEKQGYYVVRKYASKGAEDLIAIKASKVGYYNEKTKKSVFAWMSEVLLIQCKNLKVEKKLKREDAERLIKLAKQCGGTPLLASNQNHKLNIVEVT